MPDISAARAHARAARNPPAMLTLLRVEFRKVNLRLLGALAGVVFLFNTLFVLILLGINNEFLNNPVLGGFVAYSSFILLGVFLATGILAALMVAGEYSGRTINVVIASHGQRAEFVLAKYFVIFVLTALAPLITWLIVAAVSASYVLFSGNAFDVEWTSDLVDVLMFIARALLGIAFYTAVAVMLAFISKSLTTTVAAMVVFFLVAIIVELLLGRADLEQYSRFLPWGWVNQWLATDTGFGSTRPLEQVRSFPQARTLFGLLTLSTTVTMLLVTIAVFMRRDIKES